MPLATPSAIAFRLNGEPLRLPPGLSPTTTLLDWLRGPGGLTGTKEGCAEGDCGACTVVLEAADGVRVPVNACLLMLGQLHGRAVRTVEGLRGADGAPHPVQAAMAEAHATQCGFCTPGIVMTAWAHAIEGGDPHEALAGNLCRCTGYRPILDAFARLDPGEAALPPPPPEAAALFATPEQAFHRPTSLTELVALRAAHPEAWLLAGGTDLGLRVSEHRERPAAVIGVLDVPELQVLESRPEGLRIGAAVPYRQVLALAAAEPGFGPFADLLRRLGSRQIRGMGTLGGNLGTASPIGDALPPLLALGAAIRIAGPEGERDLPVEEFLTGYRRNALKPGEVVRDVFLPRPPQGALLACEKLSRRHDQDITAAGLSVLLTVEGGTIATARIAHGGLGPSAARAPQAEAALAGAPFAQASFAAAATALTGEVAPLSDLRATAEYRRLAAGNLLRRLWWRFNPAEAA
ncbi:FAD binding domain-containing protein [Roseomonas sp. OT10]|uniref:xanthine dehydrogenase small subunit n=1 Tax=Roseomonas cutis TaxID=2897332 RepID=UPI001E54C670|nr:FAD binding domain-containing protein [Roseomonas sp. OT10]UFN50133.1 FAD binding domain-containing protein [Roseomonas sp. OT10]